MQSMQFTFFKRALELDAATVCIDSRCFNRTVAQLQAWHGVKTNFAASELLSTIYVRGLARHNRECHDSSGRRLGRLQTCAPGITQRNDGQTLARTG